MPGQGEVLGLFTTRLYHWMLSCALTSPRKVMGGEVVNASLYTNSFQQCLSSPEWSREQ